MFEQEPICPYTGLRSFTEEESLYFKGRDLQVDQITALLEQNKFLMVTGASGEGKSSLIYAGLIPNARAGFFKAKFANWVVADFRPERNPVGNMAHSLANTFHTEVATVETELRRGFSSLVDLYTNSDYYIDENDDSWKQLDEGKQKQRKREAANLLVIVDQFEEFFTNPENFYNEAPSQDSQIVVNLVVESARIAIKRNLPVYIVCTMRSDYIGQCSAFRGLPEYIGFSQFFVPRLKRRDLKQVIEEPAILSGNKVSQRLIERLVYDISEGVDQLPILQHALSQIWQAAGNGREEMDLIHYAMVGGMPASELPDDEQPVFRDWFNKLPQYRKNYYSETGLNKVIEIHASILYENAWEKYNHTHPDSPISQQDAKRIIAIAFSCLTKIDNSRAVRNRMTLGEITAIVNRQPHTSEVVGDVLTTFREEGNSFIRPFKTHDPASFHLGPDAVLDITHESLIRNWNKLNTWASNEFEFYTTYLDFRKQLDRWKESGKSKDFLLPIGPLTYFENWYNKCKPNLGWIRRYSKVHTDEQYATAEAAKILADTREFLKKSARRVAVTRAFMKYGPQRIAIIAAIAIMIVLSGFYWYDAEQKQNERVIEKMRADIWTRMKSREVGFDSKAIPLLVQERYEPGSMMRFLPGLGIQERISLANETYKQLLLFNKYDTSAYKSALTRLIQSSLHEMMGSPSDYPYVISQVNTFNTLLAYDNYYNPDDSVHNILEDMADLGYRLATVFYGKSTMSAKSISVELNYGLQNWLTFGRVSGQQIDSLLDLISPFENDQARSTFDLYYPKGSYEINGRTPNVFNGGYHMLASLYAAMGNPGKVVACLETIRQSGQDDYFTGSLFNNYNNLLGIFYQFAHRESADEMIRWISSHYPSDSRITILRNALLRTGYISHFYRININKNVLRSFRGYFFPNLCLASRKVFEEIGNDYEKEVLKIGNPALRNYLMAIQKKRLAMFNDKYRYDRRLPADTASLNALLQEALAYYRKIDKDSLSAKVPITVSYYGDGIRKREYSRKHLFLYPDYMEGWFSESYHTDLFFHFIERNNLINELYTSPEDLDMIHLWVAKAYEVKPLAFADGTFDNAYPMKTETLESILKQVNGNPNGGRFDANLIYLILANRAFAQKDTTKAMAAYRHFASENFSGSRDRYEYLEKIFFLNELKDLCSNLALNGHGPEAVALAEKFEGDGLKAYAYIFMAERLYLDRADPNTFLYLDSVMSKARNVDYSQYAYGANQIIDFRMNLILLMSRIGGKEMNRLADNFLTEIPGQNKFNGIVSRVYGVAEEGNFYRAQSAIPSTLTEAEDLLARSLIVWQACRKKESGADAARWKKMDDFITHDFQYIDFLPN